LPVQLLLSKADKLKSGAQKTVLLSVKKEIAEHYGDDAQIEPQLFSSLKGIGTEVLMRKLDAWYSLEPLIAEQTEIDQED